MTEANQTDDAPPQTEKGASTEGDDLILVGRTVTINRPREELYRVWRDFERLAEFMENVASVSCADGRTCHWVVKAPGGQTVEWDAHVTEEEEGRLIAWETDENAEVRNKGRVEFRDGPPGRGTQVSALIAYEATGGKLGDVFAKLFQKDPKTQARRELKRFKQLMETGEISTTEPGPAAPRA